MPVSRDPSPRALIALFHHRWTVPTLAALAALGGGAKVVTLRHRLGVGRDSLRRTLEALVDAGLVAPNPGYGHPMRPEYVLTDRGVRLAPHCGRLVRRLERMGLLEVGLRKWTLPVVLAVTGTGGRFNRVRDALRDATPRALAQALRDLQEAGLVARYVVDGEPPHTEYVLTAEGRRLRPLLVALDDAG